MNIDRIRELAEQSAGTRKHYPGTWQFYESELVKFTQLVLKDCYNEIWKTHPIPELMINLHKKFGEPE